MKTRNLFCKILEKLIKRREEDTCAQNITVSQHQEQQKKQKEIKSKTNKQTNIYKDI